MALTIRPMTRRDLPLLSSWLAAPHVERWWQEDPSPAAVEAGYGPALDGDDPTELVIVEVDDVPVGMIQRYLNAADPAWLVALAPTGAPDDAVGIDYLIGDPTLVGQGIGTAMIGQLLADTWDRYPGASAVVVTVDTENVASWRVLEHLGFERTWTGEVHSGDPSDEGLSHCYVLPRPPSS